MLSSSYGMWQKPQLGGDGSSNLEQHTPFGMSLHNSVKINKITQHHIYKKINDKTLHLKCIQRDSYKNNLGSVFPVSRQPSRMYLGFRMTAVPDADRIHTSSLCWEEGNTMRTGQILCEKEMQQTDKCAVVLHVSIHFNTPNASALAVAHDSMATKSFGMRFDLLANLLPPGVSSLWLICKTQTSESNQFTHHV